MKTVLIVEDHEVTASAYSTALQNKGYTVISTSSVPQAVIECKTHHPDLILLDIMLPGGKHGFDFLEQLRADESTKDIPVILASNLDHQEIPAAQLNVQAYLLKANTPIEKIVEKADELLHTQQSPPTNS